MALASSNFMLTNRLSLPISTAKSHSQRAVKIIKCCKPPRPSGSEGRYPQINNVLTVADKKKMTLMPTESNAAAVNGLKPKVEEDNKNIDADAHNSTVQTTQTND